MRSSLMIVGAVLLGLFLAVWVVTCPGCGGGGGGGNGVGGGNNGGGTGDTASLTENRVELIAAQAKMQQALIDMAELAIDRSGGGQIDTSIVLSEADTRLAVGFMNTYMKEGARALVLADEMLDIVSQVSPSGVSTTGIGWLNPIGEEALKQVQEIHDAALDLAASIFQYASACGNASGSPALNVSALLQAEDDKNEAIKKFNDSMKPDVQGTIKGWVTTLLPGLSVAFQVWDKVAQATGFVERLNTISVLLTGKPLRPTVDSGQTEIIMVRAPDGAGGLAVENALPSDDRIKCFWSPDATDTELPIPSPGEAMQNVVYLANEDVDVLPMEAQKVPSVPPDVLLGSLWQTAYETLRRAAIIASDMGVDSVISISGDKVEMIPRLVDALAIQADLTDGGGYWPWTSTLGDLTTVTPTLYSTEFGVDQSHTYQVGAQVGYELNIAAPSPPPGPEPPHPGDLTGTWISSLPGRGVEYRTKPDPDVLLPGNGSGDCHWRGDVQLKLTQTGNVLTGTGGVLSDEFVSGPGYACLPVPFPSPPPPIANGSVSGTRLTFQTPGFTWEGNFTTDTMSGTVSGRSGTFYAAAEGEFHLSRKR